MKKTTMKIQNFLLWKKLYESEQVFTAWSFVEQSWCNPFFDESLGGERRSEWFHLKLRWLKFLEELLVCFVADNNSTNFGTNFSKIHCEKPVIVEKALNTPDYKSSLLF